MMMLSPAKALRYGSLSNSAIQQSSDSASSGSKPSGSTSPVAVNVKALRRSLGNGYTLDLTESIPHVVKDGHKLVRNCSTGKTVYWVCRKRKYGCPKYVHTDSAGTFIKKELGEHNHEPNQNPEVTTTPTEANKDQSGTNEGPSQSQSEKSETSADTSKPVGSTNGNLQNRFKRTKQNTVGAAKSETELNIDSANLVVSNVLAKSSESIISSIAASMAARYEDEQPGSSGLESIDGSSRKRKAALNGNQKQGEFNLSSLLGLDADESFLDDVEMGNDDDNNDMVLDLSNAKTKAYHNSNHQYANSNNDSFLSNAASVNTVPNVTFPHKNFQPIFHKFTKAVKAIQCFGRKYRRLDPATSEGLLSWRCQQKFCRYTLYTDEEVTQILKSGGKHNHELDAAEKGTLANDENRAASVERSVDTSLPSQVSVSSLLSQAPTLDPVPSNVELAAQILKFSSMQQFSDIVQQSLLNFSNLAGSLPLPEVTNLNLENIAGVQDLNKVMAKVAAKDQPNSPGTGGPATTSRVILKRKPPAVKPDETVVKASHVKTERNSSGGILDFSQCMTTNGDVRVSASHAGIEEDQKEVSHLVSSRSRTGDKSSVLLSPNLAPKSAVTMVKQQVPHQEESESDAEQETEMADPDYEVEPDLDVDEGPLWNTVPTPLPEMPDSIRDEFILINAPDGRNHVLQDGHIFSKDKCSSKSVYWRCKKKLCFAIMHTDLEMKTITFRRGEHNHSPDPKIEQRARKGHFAKMPRKPRRRRGNGANAPRNRSQADSLGANQLRSRSRAATREERRPQAIDTIGKDSLIQALTKTLNNNNHSNENQNDHQPQFQMTQTLNNTSHIDDITLPTSVAAVSPCGVGNLSVADDILAILTEATSDETKDNTTTTVTSVGSLSPDLRELLAANNDSTAEVLEDIAADPSSFLASIMASSNDGVAGFSGLNTAALGSSYLRGINKKMINNVLSKFL